MNPMSNNPNIPGSPSPFAGGGLGGPGGVNMPVGGMVQQPQPPPPGMMQPGSVGGGSGPMVVPVGPNNPPGMPPVVQSGPPPGPPPPQPPPPPPQSSSSATPGGSSSGSNTSQHDLTRLKRLVTMLRETLRNFFTIAAMNLEYNIQLDNFCKNLEQPPKLEKSLEDILALCDQIEMCLRTILECSIQLRDSRNYLPFPVSNEFFIDPQSAMMNEKTKSYAQYISVIKKQVGYAKSIYEILSESVKQIKHTESPSQPPSQPAVMSQMAQQVPVGGHNMGTVQPQPPSTPSSQLPHQQQSQPSVLASQQQQQPVGGPPVSMQTHMHQ